MVTVEHETSSGIKVLDGAFALLRALGQSDRPLGVRALARETNVTKTTVHRILNSMCQANLVTYDEPSRRYAVGPGVFASAFMAGSDLIGCAAPAMVRLWQDTAETVVLSVKSGDARVGIHQLESPEPLRFVGRVGRSYPLNAGATGRALLIQVSRKEVDAHVAATPIKPVRGPMVKAGELLEMIEEARGRGWAISRGEISTGGVAISVPLRLDLVEPAALSLYIPESRVEMDDVEGLVARLQDTATSIRDTLSLSAVGAERAHEASSQEEGSIWDI